MQRSFMTRTIICLIPTLLAAFLVVRAYMKDPQDLSGFKRGVDLSGGTILVYQVDQELSKQSKASDLKGGSDRAVADSSLAEAIKRRIDPGGLMEIIVRPVGTSRVEIILPYGARSSSSDGTKAVLNANEVENIKQKIAEVGSLEFRIMANPTDDAQAYAAAKAFLEKAQENADSPEGIELRNAANRDLPPPFPNPGVNESPYIVMQEPVRYEWVELGPNARNDYGLSVANPDSGRNYDMKPLFEANRVRGTAFENNGNLYWSRVSKDPKKQFEYFALTRSSDADRVKVGGAIRIDASVGQGKALEPAVNFNFNSAGGEKFWQVTSRNKPSTDGGSVVRNLAVLLDGKLISAPSLNQAIRQDGQITSSSFKRPDVERIVTLLRSGALPATLQRLPVSENTIGPTLGADTIRNGTMSVGLAFIAVLIFMIIYYRFAGLVATVALLANLLLTIGFMVAVNATFTLPGLAGLVLMLGMAVDANVLIYERLREERDRGMNLATSIRNGYDRALPTIIDTHLSSIFTALVLYAVGNDQLKGFGVSLSVGLVISLFTSLYMTRLIFDFFLAKGWLKQLRMLRFFSRPNIDFMKYRKPVFTATAIVTVLALGLFLGRGKNGLNVDFIGGTAYSGQLQNPANISTLRALLDEKHQKDRLQVTDVEEIPDTTGKLKNTYLIKYSDGQLATVALATSVDGETPETRSLALKERAQRLPDSSVEQVFTQASIGSESKIFNVRTTEKEPELVQAAINRLFVDGNGKSLLVETTATLKPSGDDWLFEFNVPVSKTFAKTLIERQFKKEMGSAEGMDAADVFEVIEEGDAVEGRHKQVRVVINKDANEGIQNLVKEKDGVKRVLTAAATEFAAKPQAERLEVFDGTLARETQSRAFYAIVASWIAILLYLWFRFGNWTFGAAAVICLIHDLAFTLGVIALCHFLHDTTIGSFLGLQDFKIDLPAVAALLTLVGYSVNDTIVVFDRIKEVRGKNPALTPQMINDSVNQTLSRTVLASLTTFLVVSVLYVFGGEGVHLFAFVMVIGVLIGTISSIYVASPLLLLLGEGKTKQDETTQKPAALQSV